MLWRFISLASLSDPTLESTSGEVQLSSALFSILFKFCEAVCIFACLLILTLIAEKVARKYLFGGGDIKLVASCALFLEAPMLALALMCACLISLLFALFKLPKGIPFAPCMLCGCLVALAAG